MNADRGSEMAARIDRDKATSIATRAYHAAVQEDWAAANRAMTEAGRQSPNVIALVLTRFCDTIISLGRDMAVTSPDDGIGDGPVRPVWFNADTGQATMNADDDGLPPAVRWMGQLIAARTARDFDGYQALLRAMPADGRQRGAYANALLMGCVTMTAFAAARNAARPGGAG
jgi:hypothetical protein